MNLRQQQSNTNTALEETPWYQQAEAALETSVSVPTNATTQQRFDPAAVERIIARASALQDRHQQTLSGEQIEAIAAEVGIKPEFIHAALAEETASPSGSLLTNATAGRHFLSRHQIFAAITLYGFFATLFLISAGSHDRTALGPFLCFLLPALLALGLGAGSPRRHIAMASGAMMAVASIAAMGIGYGLGGVNIHVSEQDLQIFAAMIGSGAVLGFAGAEVRRNVTRHRRKSRNQCRISRF